MEPAIQQPTTLRGKSHNDRVFGKALGYALAFTGVLALVLFVTAWVFTSFAAGLSVLGAWLLIAVFSGCSLLVLIVATPSNPGGALGLFAATYLVKVAVFGVILWLFPLAAWVDRTWLFWSALAMVLTWQVAEMLAFARFRFLRFEPVEREQR